MAWSLSMSFLCSVCERILPTVVFPDPMNPIRMMFLDVFDIFLVVPVVRERLGDAVPAEFIEHRLSESYRYHSFSYYPGSRCCAHIRAFKVRRIRFFAYYID